MKKLLVVLLVIGASFEASAQKGGGRGGGFIPSRPRTHVVVGVGAGLGYGAFRPYYGGLYSPFYYPPYPYMSGSYYGSKPSRLDLEIQEIKVDYADRIKSVKKNSELPRKERRQLIRELKTEREKAVIQAKKDYYYKRSEVSEPIRYRKSTEKSELSGEEQ